MRSHLVMGLLLLSVVVAGCMPSGDPVTPPLLDTGVDPEAWVLVPAGSFFQGQQGHEMEIDYDYEIMVTDVTNAQFSRFLNAASQDGSIRFEAGLPYGDYPGDVFHGYKHELEIPAGDYLLAALDDPGARIVLEGGLYQPIPAYAEHPVTMVTWFGARFYCQFNGWRLPDEIEWEKAARGMDKRAYPWGDTIEREHANYYSSHDIFEKLAGKSDTTPVGFYNGKVYAGYHTLDAASPYGLYDMAGNVWQWVGDDYPKQHYRYLRGGSKENYAYNLRVWTRNSAAPDYYSPNVGFRCAREP